jgi:very-short-patch-repair endonuclease
MLRTSILKGLARRKRREAIVPEKLLWSRLRGATFLRFRRQEVIGSFIVDFANLRAKVIVEVDGRTHYGDEAGEGDIQRQKYLESLGFLVLRYSNDEVLANADQVSRSIWDTVAYRVEQMPGNRHPRQ